MGRISKELSLCHEPQSKQTAHTRIAALSTLWLIMEKQQAGNVSVLGIKQDLQPKVNVDEGVYLSRVL